MGAIDATQVFMFVYGTARNDARVEREARLFADHGHEVVIFALAAPGLPDFEESGAVRTVRLPASGEVTPGAPSAVREGRSLPAKALWLGRYVRSLRGWMRRAAALADAEARRRRSRVVWHGHDLPGLAAARRAQRRGAGGSLVYDSHELFLESGSAALLPWPARSILERYERRLARRADAILTVNRTISSELARRFNVAPPAVVMNCPPASGWPLVEAGASPLRRLPSLADRRILLYHGALSPHRGIERGLEVLDRLPSEVVLVCLGDGPLQHDLQAEAARRPSRLVVHPAVPLGELPLWVAGADIGLVLFQPINRNNYMSSPNKLFECLASGTPVIVSHFPEMSSIVEEADVGVACDPSDPGAVAGSIRLLLAEDVRERAARRERCRRAAVGKYCWELESPKLLGLYDDVLAAA